MLTIEDGLVVVSGVAHVGIAEGDQFNVHITVELVISGHQLLEDELFAIRTQGFVVHGYLSDSLCGQMETRYTNGICTASHLEPTTLSFIQPTPFICLVERNHQDHNHVQANKHLSTCFHSVRLVEGGGGLLTCCALDG